MYPILVSVGSFSIYSLSVFLVLAWLVFSFLFWRALRSHGIDEDKILDLTFYATLVAFVAARALFVALNWELFADTLLKIGALWVQPGLSLYGAFVGGLVTIVSMTRSAKIRLGNVLDAFALSFPAALAVGLVGAFLDGTIVGKVTSLPWAMRVVGHVGRRHPVVLYQIVLVICIIALVWALQKRSTKQKWPYGLVGLWFFLLYSTLMFLIEFFIESRVYWVSLSASQWILIAVFAEALGAFYVRGGGREAIRPFINRAGTRIAKLFRRGA